MVRVTVEPYNIKGELQPGVRIYDALKSMGIPFRTECGGRGLCGKCKVIVKFGEVSQPTSTEKRLLSPEELASGYRLACQTLILGDARILIPPESRSRGIEAVASGKTRTLPLAPLARKVFVEVKPPSLENPQSDSEALISSLGKQRLRLEYEVLKSLPVVLRNAGWKVTATLWREDKIIKVEGGDTSSENYGLAIDIGTTKVVLQLVDLSKYKTLAILSTENPQVVYGDDIISRIHAAVQDRRNLEDMRRLMARAINNLIKVAKTNSGISEHRISSAVVVGNTAMHHIFLGLDVTGLGFSPYVPAVRESLELPGTSLGLEEVDYVYIPPNIAGYVGGDALADVVATGLHLKSEPSLLVDIGTNTEIILNTGNRLLACSTPSGPAFEGGHIKHGMKAVTGAIKRVTIQGPENVTYEVIGGEKPLGITGSGLINTIAELLRNGLLSNRGFFKKDIRTPRIIDSPNGSGKEFIIAPASETATGRDITISEKDIGEVRLAKAAIYSGIAVLLSKADLKPEQLEEVLIAGSFGFNLDVESAIRIGLLPQIDPTKIKLVGNTAVEGAKLMLTSQQAVQEAERISRETTYIELTAAPEFKRIFSQSLTFP